MTEEEILLIAKERATWEAQLMKLAEECGELSAAILRWVNQAPWSKDEQILFNEVYGEVMDVELMIKQVEVYMDPALLDMFRQAKLDRYVKRLESLKEGENFGTTKES